MLRPSKTSSGHLTAPIQIPAGGVPGEWLAIRKLRTKNSVHGKRNGAFTLIQAADRVIDLGPGRDDVGGRIVAQRAWETIADVAESYIGQYLKNVLGQKAIA
jgi:hypothetical protein